MFAPARLPGFDPKHSTKVKASVSHHQIVDGAVSQTRTLVFVMDEPKDDPENKPSKKRKKANGPNQKNFGSRLNIDAFKNAKNILLAWRCRSKLKEPINACSSNKTITSCSTPIEKRLCCDSIVGGCQPFNSNPGIWRQVGGQRYGRFNQHCPSSTNRVPGRASGC